MRYLSSHENPSHHRIVFRRFFRFCRLHSHSERRRNRCCRRGRHRGPRFTGRKAGAGSPDRWCHRWCHRCRRRSRPGAPPTPVLRARLLTPSPNWSKPQTSKPDCRDWQSGFFVVRSFAEAIRALPRNPRCPAGPHSGSLFLSSAGLSLPGLTITCCSREPGLTSFAARMSSSVNFAKRMWPLEERFQS